ncbi:MAG: hypothetical protein ABI175_09750, partial [Polyangiales bacterium]
MKVATKVASLVAVTLGVLGLGVGVARADPGSAPVADAMHDYFAGEKRSAYLWGSVGILAIGTGGALLAQKTDLTRGIAYPVIAVGAIQALYGGFLLIATPSRVTKLDERLANDSSAAVRDDELARARKNNTSFLVVEIIEAALIAGGAALAIVSHQKGSDVWKGVGLGLAIQGAAMLGLDA